MITFIISKLLQWLYGWGEYTYGTKCILTGISAFECSFFVLFIIGFCSVELPDILKAITRKKQIK